MCPFFVSSEDLFREYVLRVWCGFVPEHRGVMYETCGTMVWQPYIIQSKLEPLRAVAALLEGCVAGEEDWNP